ncbi:MAG: aminotransferase class V-fold PLP-dependent enzyme, partial [Candidatus Hodarchaeales archaeon]
MNLEKIRQSFPITDRAIYLNHAAIGPSPEPVINECEKWMVHHKAYGDMYFPDLDEMLEDLENQRQITGKFINAKCPNDEIAFSYNTSYGLSAIAEAIEWKTGDKIILNDL